MNGAAGERRYGFSSTEATANDACSSAAGERTGAGLVEQHDGARVGQLAGRGEVAALGDLLPAEGGEVGLERLRRARSRSCR